MRMIRLNVVAVSVAAGLLALAGAYYAWRHPSLFRYDLKIATGPVGSDGQKFMAVFNRELAAEYPFIRLVPVATANLSENGKALMEKQVDLAVLRSDDEAAGQGRTLFILRKVGIAILLPPDSPIEAVSDLVGKRVGLSKTAHFDAGLLDALTSFYGLRSADLVDLPPAQLGPALKAKRVAAAIVFGALGTGAMAEPFAAVRAAFKEKPSFLDIAESEAIAARFPAYDAVEIKQGAIGGMPPEPAETINTFVVTLRLVSRASLPDRAAGEITRMLLASKAKLAATHPAVGQIEAPDAEGTPVLPVHPGTLAYLNGEQASLIDETLNFYWLGAMALAIIAPIAGWLGSKAGWRGRDEIRPRLLRLVDLMRASKAATADELARAEAELDGALDWLLAKLAAGEIEPDRFHCIERMIAQLRSAIERRRAELSRGAGRIAAA